MDDYLDLEQLERKAWQSTFSDGLWDIYLGWLLVVLGLAIYLKDFGMEPVLSYGLPLLLMLMGFVLMWLGKRNISMPRLGRVQFSEARKDRRGHLRLLLLGVAALAAMLWLTYSRFSPVPSTELSSMRWLPPVVWVIAIIVVFSFIANRYDYPRFYLIGFMYASTVPLDELLTAVTGLDLSSLPFAGVGFLLMGLGFYSLRGFMQRYPLQSDAGVA